MKKHIKTISLLMTFVMLFLISAACSGDVINITYPESFQPSPPPQTEWDELIVPEDRDYFQPFSRYEETVVVTVGHFFNIDPDAPEAARGLDVGNRVFDAFIDMIYSELNIQIEVIFNVPIDEYEETLKRHRAAGTLPDTFQIPQTYEGMRFFNELIQSGELADLTQALTYAVGGLSREFLDNRNFAELYQYVSDDGKIYATAAIDHMFDTSFTWIRQDWLDELELDMPRTIEEFEEVALAFIQARLGGRNTVGLTFIPDEMFENQHGILPIFAAFGAYPASWIDVNGEAQWGGIQPETKQALALLRDWTQQGIIRSQMLTMNRTQVVDTYIITGRGGIFFSDSNQPSFTFIGRGAASQVHNEDMRWVPLLGPINAQGQYRPQNESLIQPGGQVVLASHSNPEAVIKAINLIDEVYRWRNPEFAHLWEEYFQPLERAMSAAEGAVPVRSLVYPHLMYEIANVIENYRDTGVLEVPEFLYYSGFIIDSALNATQGGMDTWWALESEERAVHLADEEESQLHLFLQRYMGYWTGVVATMFFDGVNDGTYVEMVPAFVGEAPSWSEYERDLMRLQQTTFIQIISGRLPLEAFDDFVAEWLELGGATVTGEINELLRN